MPFVSRIGAALASTLILLAPAIWNRFPLLQYDTGGYLARWYEGYLVPSRSTVYGLFLNLFAQPDFWPVVVIQAALTVWVLALVLRALGFGGRPLLLIGVTAALSGLTTLPWLDQHPAHRHLRRPRGAGAASADLRSTTRCAGGSASH